MRGASCIPLVARPVPWTEGKGAEFPEVVWKWGVVRTGQSATAGALAELADVFGRVAAGVHPAGDGTAMSDVLFGAEDGVGVGVVGEVDRSEVDGSEVGSGAEHKGQGTIADCGSRIADWESELALWAKKDSNLLSH